MIRVAIHDRHPAVRAGLEALLHGQPGLTPVGCAGQRRELLALLYRSDPDVLLLDDPGLVRMVKTEAPRTRVILYLADPSPETFLAAAIAGADSVVDKSAEPRELLLALRGERMLPRVAPGPQARAAARLDPRDRPIFAMRLAGTSPREIASVVGMTVAALNARVQAIVAQLAPPRAATGFA